MPDSNAVSGQDDAGRVNGLMSAMNRKEAENAALREQLSALESQGSIEAQEPAQPVDSQPEYEEGVSYRLDPETGQLVAQDPPTPRHNQTPREPRQSGDDGSAAYVRAQLAKIGVTERDTSWP